MKKQIFSGKLYLQSLKRLRTFGIAMIIVTLLIGIFAPIDGIMDNRHFQDIIIEPAYTTDDFGAVIEYEGEIYWSGVSDRRVTTPLSDLQFSTTLLIMLIFAPLGVYLLFSFMNERRGSDFYHALPETRVCAYISMMAALFTWIEGTILLNVGVSALLWSFAKCYSFTLMTVISNLVYYTVISLFMAGLMSLAMMLTGTALCALMNFFYIMVFPIYAYCLFVSALEHMAPVLPLSFQEHIEAPINKFLPLNWLWGGRDTQYFLSDVPLVILFAVVGLVLLVGAGVLYHFRRSETAGKSAPSATMQHIYRIAFATVAALLIPYFICMEDTGSFLLLFVLLTAVVYVVYELLTTKRVGKMVKSLPLLFVPFALAAAFGLSLLACKTVIYSILPEEDEVESIRVVDIGEWSYGGNALEGEVIVDRGAIETMVDALAICLDGDQNFSNGRMAYHADIAFRLKNGKTIERTLVMQEELWEKFILSGSVRDIYLALPRAEEITYIETEHGRLHKPSEVWNILRDEFELMSDADKIQFTYRGYSKYFTDTDPLFVEVWVKMPDGNGSYIASYPLTKTKTPKAYAILSDEKTYSSTDKTTEWVENYDEDIVFYE